MKDMRYLFAVTQGAAYVGASRLALALAMVGWLACSGPSSGAGSAPDAGTDSGMDSGVPERRMFVTSTVQTAALGGVAGADELCAMQAADANLVGDFKAWLSTLSSSVSDRLAHSSVPYVLVDGTMVASDWDDLVDGALLAPINRDASGQLRTGDAWTGTLATGASYLGSDCASFTSGSAGAAQCGAVGSTTLTWTENIVPACSTRLRLYCIEQ